MTNPPYTARIHRRIDVLLIGVTIVILLLILLSSARAGSWAAWAGDRTSDRYVEEDSWWAERAAAFFPRYHFTLQATGLVSRDIDRPSRASGAGTPGSLSRPPLVTPPDVILATRTWDGGGANDNWDTVNNWDNNALPAATDDVVFGTAFRIRHEHQSEWEPNGQQLHHQHNDRFYASAATH